MTEKKQSGLGIYVHVPFCRTKCFYCDFYSRNNISLQNIFSDALIFEARRRVNEVKVLPTTLYFGGGTPSILSKENFKKISSSILSIFFGDRKPIEFTIEVNPEDVDFEKIEAWKECGVDRISMGIQSLNDNELRAIGRRHNAETAIKAYYNLRDYFSNISVDVMFGLPGQSLETLKETLKTIIDLQPEHISIYSLMYEERTALTKMKENGRIIPIGDDVMVDMFNLVNELTQASGYERYEISNYSRNGFRSKHNSSYWSGAPYIGLGPSAHSYDGKTTRRRNIEDTKAYISGYLNDLTNDMSKNESFLYELEHLSQEELREEYILTRLRRREGINLLEYSNYFGERMLEKLLSNAKRPINMGLLKILNNCLTLTDKGIMISDDVILDLVI